MAKPTVFLSHITEEAELATAFRQEIEESFLGLVEVFQSSEPKSLRIGENWLNNITEALRSCEAIIVFCSPYSVRRPWINFECGAGWSRNIEVVPICHSGLRPVDLPVPLSLLQGLDGADPSVLSQLFDLISRKLGGKTPRVNTDALARKVSSFSKEYVEEVELMNSLRSIRAASGELIDLISKLTPNQVSPISNVPERLVERCRGPLDDLQKRKYLSYSFATNGISFAGPGENGGGNFGHLTLQVGEVAIAAAKKILTTT